MPATRPLTSEGMRPSSSADVLYGIVCAAPAAAKVGEFVQIGQRAGWSVRLVATPMAVRFAEVSELADLTGDRVRSSFRMPGEADDLPPADAVVVAPVTFNTVNKWAAGIADNFAVGLLCELTGAGVPILAVPQVKNALARHSAFVRSLDSLRAMGVHVLFDPQAPPDARMPEWPRVLEELHAVTVG